MCLLCRQEEAGAGRSDADAGLSVVCPEEERRLLLLPACNAVSAGLLLRRAGGLAQLGAAPLGRLVQLVPELPVRVLATLQRHLQQPEQTPAASGWVPVEPAATGVSTLRLKWASFHPRRHGGLMQPPLGFQIRWYSYYCCRCRNEKSYSRRKISLKNSFFLIW